MLEKTAASPLSAKRIRLEKLTIGIRRIEKEIGKVEGLMNTSALNYLNSIEGLIVDKTLLKKNDMKKEYDGEYFENEELKSVREDIGKVEGLMKSSDLKDNMKKAFDGEYYDYDQLKSRLEDILLELIEARDILTDALISVLDEKSKGAATSSEVPFKTAVNDDDVISNFDSMNIENKNKTPAKALKSAVVTPPKMP